MQFLVGYNGTSAAKAALSLARDHAKIFNARILILLSSEGGASETLEDISKIESELEEAREFVSQSDVECETHQLARGMTPGEDIVSFAEEKKVDQIFVGIEKKSRTRKLLLGSTAQYVILKASCPVVTIK